jgi:hypothetical protein
MARGHTMNGKNSVSKWQPVYNHHSKVIGRVRRVSSAFAPDQQWEIEGVEGVTFEDVFDAQKYLAEQDGLRYQVKTEMSHRFWTGTQMGEELDRSAGRVYAREIDAERVASQFETKGWDKVCVAAWRPDNFGK